MPTSRRTVHSAGEKDGHSPEGVAMRGLEIAERRAASFEDDVWIHQTLAGDREAFGRLIEKYKDPLFDLAFRMLRNRTEAEDVLQDSFLEAYRHLSGFNHQSRFSTWVYTIVLNRVRNLLRHNRVLRWSSLDKPMENQEGEKALELPDKGPALDALAEKKLQVQAIEREVRTLPVHYQSIFILHYFQDLPMGEVAKRLNRPIGTIKAYLHRSRKLLYKRLVARPLADPDPSQAELLIV
jgi:RNA polymerase sigma-70 factor (ECF subfamily)